MSARTVILNTLDPSGERGLAIDVQAAFEAGATDVMPIATSTLVDGVMHAVDSKVLAATLSAALESPVQAMLVGRLPNSKVAGAIASALAQDLPETMVFAPGEFVPSRAWFAGDSGSVRALDHIVTGEHKAVLDYPGISAEKPDRIPGALTALLAVGLTLEEAVAGAQRHAACPNTTGAAVCR
jgi:hypothetical protein